MITVKAGFGKERKTLEIDVPTGEPRPWDADTKLDIVGRPVPRVDGHLKVSGKARYTTDVRDKGMLHAAVLRCPVPCARVTIRYARFVMPRVSCALF